MSVVTELSALVGYITAAYGKVGDKGGTIPANKNMANLAGAIDTITGGGGVGIPRDVDANGKMIFPAGTWELPSTVTDVDAYAMRYAQYNNTGLTSVDLSSLEDVSGNYALASAFQGCTGLTSIDLSGLMQLTGDYALSYAFNSCTGITSADLSSLQTVTGQYGLQRTFAGCTSLTSVSLSSLTTAGVYALSYTFFECTGLTSLSLPELTTITGNSALGYIISGCTSLTSFSVPKLESITAQYGARYMLGSTSAVPLTSVTFTALTDIGVNNALSNLMGSGGITGIDIYFPALTTSSFGHSNSQFQNMLYNSSNNTVHFPAAVQSTIGSWATITSGMGGTNTTVLYDL